MKHYDLIIIGGGAGAFAAAIKADELKKKTLMINDGIPLGGTCVNVGCVPSKTLIRAAEVLHYTKHHGIPGIELDIASFDFKKVVQDELKLVSKMRIEKYENILKKLTYVTFEKGWGSFVSQREVKVNDRIYSAEKIIIATGSKATIPDIKGIDEVGYLTHIEALKLQQLPKRLMILGGGIVALEFAQMYARFGSKVTIIHHSERLFRAAEEGLVVRLLEILKNEGVEIHMSTEVNEMKFEKNEKILSCVQDGKIFDVATDEVLVAIGKTPNIGGLQLEKAGVEVDKRASVVVQSSLQTSQAHIYAVGDVNNHPLRLEATAGKEGSLAVENAMTGRKKEIDFQLVPYTLFTDPELAAVGMTEKQVIEEYGACECRTLPFSKVPRAIITRQTEGLIKMIVHPESKQILGIHILGPHAGELVAEAMVLVRNKNTIYEVMNDLPMFPTLAEAIKLVAVTFVKDLESLSCCV